MDVWFIFCVYNNNSGNGSRVFTWSNIKMSEQQKDAIVIIVMIMFSIGFIAWLVARWISRDEECTWWWKIIKENNVVNNGVVYWQNYTVRCKETGKIKHYKNFY